MNRELNHFYFDFLTSKVPEISSIYPPKIQVSFLKAINFHHNFVFLFQTSFLFRFDFQKKSSVTWNNSWVNNWHLQYCALNSLAEKRNKRKDIKIMLLQKLLVIKLNFGNTRYSQWKFKLSCFIRKSNTFTFFTSWIIDDLWNAKWN